MNGRNIVNILNDIRENSALYGLMSSGRLIVVTRKDDKLAVPEDELNSIMGSMMCDKKLVTTTPDELPSHLPPNQYEMIFLVCNGGTTEQLVPSLAFLLENHQDFGSVRFEEIRKTDTETGLERIQYRRYDHFPL